MELWIRSQNNKELIKINHLVLMAEEIRGVIDNGDYIMLGTYETKERALEVLDAIQTLIEEYYDCLDNKIVLAPVYQMPKE